MWKKILVFATLSLIVLVIWNWSLLAYAFQLGVGQARIIWNTRPVSEFMSDPVFPDSLRQKLELIAAVRRFGMDSLGLADTDNYTTLYDQQGREVMWVVQACPPFDLSPKTWTFPIAGEVPYKGFFDSTAAATEADKLRIQGYDVRVRNPAGWSTLGWFTDPILSAMLYRSEGQLANLILHEMVHATVYVKGDGTFNENLATFVGDTATYLFLSHHFGEDAPPYVQYSQKEADQKKLMKHFVGGAHQLDSLYHTFQEIDAVAAKQQQKMAMINYIMEAMDTLALHRRRRRQMPDNTFFMSYLLYHGEQGNFRQEMTEHGGSVPAYIRYLRRTYPN